MVNTFVKLKLTRVYIIPLLLYFIATQRTFDISNKRGANGNKRSAISNMTLEISEVARQAKNVFDDKTYNTLLEAAITLFGKRSVTASVDNRIIVIKDNINLTLSLSGNETKVYVYSYITDHSEIWSELHYTNDSFRLFGITEMVKYLELKKAESEFIRQFEG